MDTSLPLKNAMVRIQAASQQSNVAEIERLSKIAKRLKEIEIHQEALNSEIAALDASLDSPAKLAQAQVAVMDLFSHPPAHGPKGELEVVIDWPACGVSRPKAVVSEYKASETLVSFMAEVNATLGAEALLKLTQLRVNRGPLLSENPSKDFVNSKRGTEYAHHQVPGSRFHVLTHSSTQEKRDAIRRAWKTLGLQPGGLSFTQVA
ncbi:MAG: hypothetical protein WAK51_08730 [Opitutaceae bacterium]